MSCCVPGGDKPDTSGASAFFDTQAQAYLKRFQKKGFEKSQKKLFAEILRFEIDGKSVLEIGSGVGFFILQLLEAGASRATGYDLSPKMVQLAKEYSKERGYQDRTIFLLDDFAQNPLSQPHDLVILDKVICCYENWPKLLDASLAVTNELYLITVPRNSKLVRAVFRFLPWLTKFFRIGFHPYFHNHNSIEHLVSQRGFTKIVDENIGLWNNKVFVKGNF